MSITTIVLSQLQFIAVWLRSTFFGLKLDSTQALVLSARRGPEKAWFSASSANEFERSQLAEKEVYRLLARLPVAR